MAGYSEDEISLIGKWLRDGLSASQISDRLSNHRHDLVSRNAIIGIVHRNKALKAIGFAREGSSHDGGRPRSTGRLPEKKPERKPVTERAHLNPANMRAREESRTSSPGYVPPTKAPVADGLKPAEYDRQSRRIPLVDLGWRDCRFVVNDPERGELHLFCGHPQDEGSSYCRHHRLRCRGEGTVSERHFRLTALRAA